MAEVIVEFCQNHKGNFKNLEKMVNIASLAGVKYCKIQTIFAKNVSFRPQFENGLVVDGVTKAIKRPMNAEIERLKELELSWSEMKDFVELCLSKNVIPITTCFAREHIEPILNCGFQHIKIASYDCASYKLLKEIKNNFHHIIISTGATYDDEIECAAAILKGTKYSFLHCVTIYPTPLNAISLSRMNWLKKFTPSVGFSDHTSASKDGLLAPKAAFLMGADFVERHFMLNEIDDVRDAPVSINENQLTELVQFSKMSPQNQKSELSIKENIFKEMLGDEKRKLSTEEILNRDYYRGRFMSLKGDRMISNWDETVL